MFEIPAFEIILQLALQLLGNGIHNHGSLRNLRKGEFHATGNMRLATEICAKPFPSRGLNPLSQTPKQRCPH